MLSTLISDFVQVTLFWIHNKLDFGGIKADRSVFTGSRSLQLIVDYIMRYVLLDDLFSTSVKSFKTLYVKKQRQKTKNKQEPMLQDKA